MNKWFPFLDISMSVCFSTRNHLIYCFTWQPSVWQNINEVYFPVSKTGKMKWTPSGFDCRWERVEQHKQKHLHIKAPVLCAAQSLLLCFVCVALSLGECGAVLWWITGRIYGVVTDFWARREILIQLSTFWLCPCEYLYERKVLSVCERQRQETTFKTLSIMIYFILCASLGCNSTQPQRKLVKVSLNAPLKESRDARCEERSRNSPDISRKRGNAGGAERSFPNLATIQWNGM